MTFVSGLTPLARRGLAVALMTTALAGCAGNNKDPLATGSVDLDGYRSVHPIVVQEGLETLDLPVGAHQTRLSPAIAATVEGFAKAAVAERVTTVVVMTPTGSQNAAAVGRAQREITDILSRNGIPSHSIERRTYEAEGPQDVAPIRLAYPHLVAGVPHRCGEWPRSALSDWGNGDYWNYGCAYQANIAAMAAVPSDLVVPRPLGAPDATRRADVLDKYRKGQKTATDTGLPSPGVGAVSGGGSSQ